jgi:hypothetical protein
MITFCPWVHRTICCTSNTAQCAIYFLNQSSQLLLAFDRLEHKTVRWVLSIVAEMMWPATDHAPTVGAGQSRWPPSVPDMSGEF